MSSAACIAYESGVACSVGVNYFVHDPRVRRCGYIIALGAVRSARLHEREEEQCIIMIIISNIFLSSQPAASNRLLPGTKFFMGVLLYGGCKRAFEAGDIGNAHPTRTIAVGVIWYPE